MSTTMAPEITLNGLNNTSINNNTCSQEAHGTDMTVAFVSVMVIAIAGIIANIVGITAIRTAMGEFRPVHNFLLNLSIADICMCVSAFTTHAIHYMQCGAVKDIVKKVLMLVAPISVYGQSGCLLLLALDHYLVIVYPLRCHTLLNQRRCFAVICSQWGVATLVSSVYAVCYYSNPTQKSPYDLNNCEDENKVNAVYFILVFLAMFVLYVRVFMEIYRMPDLALCGVNKRRNKKAIKTTLMILGTYFLLMGPQWVSLIIYEIIGKTFGAGPLFPFLNCLMILNCSCDPVIYSLRMRDVRKGFMKICSICKSEDTETSRTRRHLHTPVNQINAVTSFQM